jgi:hypothetical protein
MGVAISPNLLVNFVSDAGQKMPGELAKVLPKLPNMGNPMSNKASTNFTMPSDLLDKLQTSDVTSIFSVIKEFVNTMLTNLQATIGNNPFVDFAKIKAEYLASLDKARPLIENTFQSTLNKGYANLFIGTTIIAFIGILFLSFFIFGITFAHLNHIFDPHEPERYVVAIEDEGYYSGIGRYRIGKWEFKVTINGEKETIVVPRHHAYQFQEGDLYVVEYHKGAFNEPYYIGVGAP